MIEELEDMAEFHRRLMYIFSRKFHEQFPDAFINCTTLDKQVYETSNQSQYTYYMKILNSLAIWDHWNWRIASYHPDYLWQRHVMLESLEISGNVMMWAFNNIKIN